MKKDLGLALINITDQTPCCIFIHFQLSRHGYFLTKWHKYVLVQCSNQKLQSNVDYDVKQTKIFFMWHENLLVYLLIFLVSSQHE